jgi:hypothetical protein
VLQSFFASAMLARSLVFLLLVGSPAIAADAFPNDPEFVDIGRYEPATFIPFSLQPPADFVHQNGSSKRASGPCYGMCARTLMLYLSARHLTNASKIQEEEGSCGADAVCCDNGSCAGTGQICCAGGICDAGYGCCQGISCVLQTRTCCDTGGSCPPGNGCFSYNNSPQIFCSPTGGGSPPATSTITPESTTSSVIEPTSAVPTSAVTTSAVPTSAALGASSEYYSTYQ